MTKTQKDDAVMFGGALLFAVVIGVAIGINLDMPSDWTPAAIVCRADDAACAEILANNRHIVGSPYAWYGLRQAKLSDEAKIICLNGCFVKTLFNQVGTCGHACDLHQETPAYRPIFEPQCKEASFVGPCLHVENGTAIQSASVSQ